MLGELGEQASEDSGNRASLQMQWHLGSSDHRQDGEIQLVSVGFSWNFRNNYQLDVTKISTKTRRAQLVVRTNSR